MNFNLGTTGAGFYLIGSLVIFLSSFSAEASFSFVFKLIAPILVSLGFLSLASEVGRPMRFYYLYRNAGTSWISRETFVTCLFVFTSLIEWFYPLKILWFTAAAGAISIIISQGLIVYHSRALPAWNVFMIPILFITSGFVCGGGLFLMWASIFAMHIVKLVALITIITTIINFFSFLFYLYGIRDKIFREAIIGMLRLKNLAASIVFFHLLPAVLIVPIVISKDIQNLIGITRLLAIISGSLILLGGWNLKAKIILNAGGFRKITLEDSDSTV